jgi:hypothetical protein
VIQMMMRVDTVYQYPIWAVGVSLAIIAVIGTILLEFAMRRFVSSTLRLQHNEIAAAIFSIIGVTCAVPVYRCESEGGHMMSLCAINPTAELMPRKISLVRIRHRRYFPHPWRQHCNLDR